MKKKQLTHLTWRYRFDRLEWSTMKNNTYLCITSQNDVSKTIFKDVKIKNKRPKMMSNSSEICTSIWKAGNGI